MAALDRILNDLDLDHSLGWLFASLRIPSISTDPAYAAECQKAAEWLKGDLAAMGFEASLRETGGHPVVLAHYAKPGTPHVLPYGHYDLQTVDSLDQWETPLFEPRMAALPYGRNVISARGTCDDKGQWVTLVEAYRAFKVIDGEFLVGITNMLESTEEDGSKLLPKWFAANREELKADFALICDIGSWEMTDLVATPSLYSDWDGCSGLVATIIINPAEVKENIKSNFIKCAIFIIGGMNAECKVCYFNKDAILGVLVSKVYRAFTRSRSCNHPSTRTRHNVMINEQAEAFDIMTKSLKINESAKEKSDTTEKKSGADRSTRMQIFLSKKSLDSLDDLKDKTESASYGETVRRAVQFYKKVHDLHIDAHSIEDENATSSKQSFRIQIVVSEKTLERIEEMREASQYKRSYSEIVRAALRWYTRVSNSKFSGNKEIVEIEGKKINLNDLMPA